MTPEYKVLPIDQLATHPNQPRLEPANVKALADSIKSIGQVTPLLIAGGNAHYTIVDGHCRVAAMKKLGMKEAECIVIDYGQESEGELLSTAALMGSNVTRTDFTDMEKAQGYQTLLELGLNEENIAKISGETLRDVKRFLAVKELDTSSHGAKIATLYEAEALLFAQQNKQWYADGEDDILEAMETDDVDHAYARLKQTVKERKQIGALMAKYPEGTNFTEHYGYGTPIVALDDLTDKMGNQLTEKNHAGCPGHIGVISGYQEKHVWWACEEPKKYGHKEKKHKPAEGSQQAKDAEKMREGRAFKKDMIAPTEVRREWIVNTLLAKDVDKLKGVWPYVLENVSARRPSTRPDLYWEWMHKKRPAHYDDLAKFVGKTALKGILVACLVTDDEDCRMCQGPSHFRAQAMPRYLTFLQANGYKLSDHEAKLLTYTPPPNPYASYNPSHPTAQTPDEEDVEYEDSVSSDTQDVD